MSLLVYIIICVLVIVLIILLTFAIYYNKLAYECSTYPLSWCNNWYCRLGSDETVNNKMIAAGIVPVGSQPGYEYSVTNDVYIPALTKCTYNTTDLLWFDTTTKIPCNPTNNPNGDPNNPNCKATPRGCLTNLYGDILTQSQIWGSRT